MWAISEREAKKHGYRIFDTSHRFKDIIFEEGEAVELGKATNDPYTKAQDKGIVYFGDNVATGETCFTPVKTYKDLRIA